MADIKSPKNRSINMSKIRSKDTKPEEYIRKLFYANGYRYRKNVDFITGHPDIWLSKYNTAVFVNGCFWHRHEGCRFSYTPKTRVDFWIKKFNANVERDKKVKEVLRGNNVRILIIWECTVKRMMKSVDVQNEFMKKINDFIWSENDYREF